MNDPSGEVTQLLLRLGSGGGEAWEPLLELVYLELRRLAQEKMACERPGHTLQPTALVHEAFLRLVKDERLRFSSRQHFFAIAARAMERVLIDHARARRAVKRKPGPAMSRQEEIGEVERRASRDLTLSADREEIAAALGKLEKMESLQGGRKADAIRLRYLLELPVEEVAETLGMSVDTVQRDIRFALAWLADRLKASRE